MNVATATADVKKSRLAITIIFSGKPRMIVECNDLAEQITLERVGRRIFQSALRCWKRFGGECT